jgi:hypothetical protein
MRSFSIWQSRRLSKRQGLAAFGKSKIGRGRSFVGSKRATTAATHIRADLMFSAETGDRRDASIAARR